MNKKGFTLTEVMIAFAIIAMILITSYFVFFKQIFKAQDGKRKADLHTLTNILEDFYNDSGCYPKPTEICYDPDGNEPCHICGKEADPMPNFRLPCNPDHPEKKYLYEVENSTCPQWYRIYTELSNPDESEGCIHGSCGPDGGGFDYGVSSPNVDLEKSDELWGYEPGENGTCSVCGSPEDCEDQLNGGHITEIYGTYSHCCNNNLEATNCTWYGWDLADCTECHGTMTECDKELEKFYFNDPDPDQPDQQTAEEKCCEDHLTAPSCL